MPLTARKTVEETLARAREPWDFVFFTRLEDKTFPILEQVAKECKRLNKPVCTYYLFGTSKNAEMVKMISWLDHRNHGKTLKTSPANSTD